MCGFFSLEGLAYKGSFAGKLVVESSASLRDGRSEAGNPYDGSVCIPHANAGERSHTAIHAIDWCDFDIDGKSVLGACRSSSGPSPPNH